ncbi:MAG: type 1 glutamine amidotransferase domain-containing protein [Kiritimatiellae bacterium]|jgi:putative intracellular protease/amidase|nr:type 1 glutamine amidotransferase domain-containing protein [Kiritimatiellia bacterium]
MLPMEYIGIILLIVTSHGEMDNQKATGLWLEEFAVPYEAFMDACYRVIVASPEGGAAPIDPRSLPENPSDSEKVAMRLLTKTMALSDLPDLPYKGIFFAGGHGTMFDFPNDPNVQKLVAEAIASDTPLALVCHGPAALVGAKTADGEPVAKGRNLTGFTNSEEEAVQLVEEMPFLLETRLKEQGAEFSSAENFQEYVVVDKYLVTGQNPSSSHKTAEEFLILIQKD